jgi:cell division protein FtsA
MGLKLPFFKSKKTEEGTTRQQYDPEQIQLALDVGTRYIKAVLFKVTSPSEITIIGYSRTAQKYGAMRDAMIVNLQNVIEACDLCVGRALEIAEKRFGQVNLPTRAVIGIAGELVKGASIIANYERDNRDQKITQDEIDSVVEQVKEESFAGALEEIAVEIGVDADQIEEINSRIDTTEIDGVVVSNPLGFTGSKVSYRVYSTFAPKLHVNSLYELAGQLGLDEASIVVQPYAVARSMKELREPNTGAIVIDMGGGTTDVALVNNGGVLGTKMFAFGGDVLTKRIAEALNREIPQAEDLKLEYSDGNLPAAQQKEIKSIVNQDMKIWVEGVQIALEELLDDEEGDLDKLPSQIYLCGGGVALPEVREVMLAHPWLTVLPFAKFPKVNYLFPNQLIGIKDETRLLIEPSDVTPASLAHMLVDEG